MFENLFPILGQLVTISMVGALIGSGAAMFAAHVAANHAAHKKLRATNENGRARRSAPSRMSFTA